MTNHLDIVVRSTELDPLGHVNNARYLEYLEWGRFEWFSETGFPIDLFGSGRVSAVIVNVNINFRREARLGDRLRIETRLVHQGRSSFRFAQEVVQVEDGERVCDALVTGATFDTVERASIPIPDEVRRHFERFLENPSGGTDSGRAGRP